MFARLSTCIVLSALLLSLDSSWTAADESPDHPANHLAGETSPYLLMHVHNPVDWYPWGKEAFEIAQRDGKLVFLSIGYSSCYWCHVMERESFSDDEVAEFLNKHFVCIKVDREERPDVDDLYMTSLQVYFQMIGSPQGGGWPLSMFLTPDGNPVFGGTYFPPRGRDGRPGFIDVLGFIRKSWIDQPDKLRQNGKTLAAAVRETRQGNATVDISESDDGIVDDTFSALKKQFDSQYGGFGYSAQDARRPKFPEPSNLMLLLEIAGDQSDQHTSNANDMLVLTLDKMLQGGIWDHVGGGFHRYSTDRYWHVPHFEKMLYDNGQLATVYSEAHALTGRDDYARAATAILDFILREMTGEEGGFYAAIDAETDAEEGRFYVWTNEQLRATLTADELQLVKSVYGIGESPNFEGSHVLLMREPFDEIARRRGTSADQLRTELAPIRRKLLTERDRRERPLTDTKIITSWNGLMIRGFADAGRILQEPRYVDAAARAADFVLDTLRQPDGRLWRTYRSGQAKLNGYLDDYAFFVDGLLALHRATDDPRWLTTADVLTQKQIELFWDDAAGGFWFTSHDHEELFARLKKPVDGALPSGNSVAAENLLYLAKVLPRPEFRQRAAQTMGSSLPLMRRAPTAAPRMAVALRRYFEVD